MANTYIGKYSISLVRREMSTKIIMNEIPLSRKKKLQYTNENKC
jgi:hypothetical protein